MAEPSVTLEVRPLAERPDARVAIVTLNRPDTLNAIDTGVLGDFDAAIDGAVAASVRAVLVTGAGRAFSAGGDLKAYLTLQRDAQAFSAFVERFHRTFGRLRSLPVPVIALVNGVTAAGGLELLLNCDLVVAAESARIGDGHLNYGQMGGGGVLTLLPKVIGILRSRELVLSGRLLPAAEAAEWGLVNRVVPDGQLLATGIGLAEEIAAKSPLATANAKQVMNTIWSEELAVTAGLVLERDRNSFYCSTAFDAQEGLTAFSEKRTPRYEGR